MESRAQLTIISGTANHFHHLVWTTHGIACSVRECGRHEGFRPGLLPHLLSRLLVIKPYSPKEKPRELGQIHDSLDLLMYGELEQTSSVLERFSLATVVIKMRRVIEIRFRGRRRAGPQPQPFSGANRFLGFSAKTGDIFT